jgi:hypothetical protein
MLRTVFDVQSFAANIVEQTSQLIQCSAQHRRVVVMRHPHKAISVSTEDKHHKRIREWIAVATFHHGVGQHVQSGGRHLQRTR